MCKASEIKAEDRGKEEANVGRSEVRIPRYKYLQFVHLHDKNFDVRQSPKKSWLKILDALLLVTFLITFWTRVVLDNVFLSL